MILCIGGCALFSICLIYIFNTCCPIIVLAAFGVWMWCPVVRTLVCGGQFFLYEAAIISHSRLLPTDAPLVHQVTVESSNCTGWIPKQRIRQSTLRRLRRVRYVQVWTFNLTEEIGSCTSTCAFDRYSFVAVSRAIIVHFMTL